MKTDTIPHSLQSKISSSYYSIVLILLLFGLLSISDLLYLKQQSSQGQVIASFEEEVLEMRREEKNFLLYKQAEAQALAVKHARAALTLLNDNQSVFSELVGTPSSSKLHQELERYRHQIEHWSQRDSEAIRMQGRTITVQAEEIKAIEEQVLKQHATDALNLMILGLILTSTLVLLIGRRLRKHAIEPLTLVEQDLKLLAKGERTQVVSPSDDREFVLFTEQLNRALRELEHRRRRMMHSEKLVSLGNLAAGVAHELNNPLSNIYTASQLLTEETSLSSRQQRWLQQILSETERGRDIIQSLLDFGSKRPFQKQPEKLSEIIKNTLHIIGKVLQQSGATIEIHVSESLTLPIDRLQIQQALINLIENSLQAGATELQLSATACEAGANLIPEDAERIGSQACEALDQRPMVEILLSDNGTGIPKDQINSIFDPFYTNQPPGEGTGLGLYIVQEVINNHDGCLAIRSTPKRGTQITLLLSNN